MNATRDASEFSDHRNISIHSDQESKVIELLSLEYSEPSQKSYLHDRVAIRLELAHRGSRSARRIFYTTRIAVIAAGVLLPAAVTAQTQAHGTARIWLSVCAITLSVALAVASGILQMTRVDKHLRLSHWMWIEIRNEIWALSQRRGAYTEPDSAMRFNTFVDRVESLLQNFESGILDTMIDKGDDDTKSSSLDRSRGPM